LRKKKQAEIKSEKEASKHSLRKKKQAEIKSEKEASKHSSIH
jgi:hypothetical protein